MRKKTNFRSNCPINFTQEILGDKWSLLIIRDLMFAGKRHYGEFLNSEEKISTNILADRLVKLERNGLISKVVDKQNLSKKIYSLTPKGIHLMPVLFEMISWGLKYNVKTLVPPDFLKYMRADKDAFLKHLMTGLHKSQTQSN